MSQHVFVTGGTGVLGRRVVRQLIEAGHSVTAIARSDEKAAELRFAGASPVKVDLFDPVALREAFRGHDAVANLATNIPSGASSANPRAWRPNDRLRREASAAVADATVKAGVSRMIQESITFPYVDSGSNWIGEDQLRTYFPLNRTVVDAETAAASVAQSGASFVVLRFAMFMAPESAHMSMAMAAAKRGVFGLVGNLDSFISFVHADDAASAVVHALGISSGVYNVAEADPCVRAAHQSALAAAAGRSTLRTVPHLIASLGGKAVESIARSHRISTRHLQSLSDWRPQIRCVDAWAEVRTEKD
jgi:nucleoside-diphosphate-sugar epimerase